MISIPLLIKMMMMEKHWQHHTKLLLPSWYLCQCSASWWTWLSSSPSSAPGTSSGTGTRASIFLWLFLFWPRTASTLYFLEFFFFVAVTFQLFIRWVKEDKKESQPLFSDRAVILFDVGAGVLEIVLDSDNSVSSSSHGLSSHSSNLFSSQNEESFNNQNHFV